MVAYLTFLLSMIMKHNISQEVVICLSKGLHTYCGISSLLGSAQFIKFYPPVANQAIFRDALDDGHKKPRK